MKNWIKNHKIITIVSLLLIGILIADVTMYYLSYYKTIKFAMITNQDYHLIIPDAFAIWNGFIQEGATTILQFIFPLIVMISATYKFYQYQKSGMFKHVILQGNYKDYIKNQIIHCWKYAIIIPIFLLISFIICIFLSKFQFNYVAGSPLGRAPYTDMLSNIIYIVVKMINLGIASIFCINITLFFIKKGYNYLIVIFLSFLSIFAYQAIAELVFGRILTDFTGNLFFVNGITLFGFWIYDTGVNNFNTFLNAMFLFLSSSLIVFLTYKNREKVIIDEEK